MLEQIKDKIMVGFAIEDFLTAISVILLIATLVLVLVSLPKLKLYLPALKQYRHLLFTLVARDLKVKYRRSILGMLWSVLNPLFMMLILTAVFSRLVKIEDYAVYYITGAMIFNFVSEATSSSMTSVINSAALIKKVYIPKYIFPLQKCIFSIVNMLFTLIAVALVYLIMQFPIQPTIVLLFIPMLYAAVFALGLSLMLSALDVFFRDIGHLWSVWVVAWMYLTPILYPLDILSEPVQAILKFNPVYHFVQYARDVMMYGVIPGLQANLICAGYACLFLLLGLLVFKKTQDRFILHI
jgi:ABC-2 type transport system permease protein